MAWSLYLLVLARLSAFLSVAPVFNLRQGGTLVRVGLAALVAALVLPVVEGFALSVPGDLRTFIAALLVEVAVGLTLGFACSLLFSLFQVAGGLLDLEMGLGMANLLDPTSGSSNSLLEQFLVVVGTLIFLEVDGHHALLLSIVQSFRVLPPVAAVPDIGAVSGVMVQSLGWTYLEGLRLASPALAALVLADVALALVARSVPQLNVFLVSFPVKIALGLFLLGLSLPLLSGAAALLLKGVQEVFKELLPLL